MAKRKRKINLNASYKHSHETKERKSDKTVFIPAKIKGKKLFVPEEGDNVISIVPYEIKTEKHPLEPRGARSCPSPR